MPVDFKVNCLEKLKKMNRLVYILMILVSVMSAGAGLTRSIFIIGYYILIANAFLLSDEYLIYKKTELIKDQESFPSFLMSIRTYIYVFLLAFAAIFEQLPPILFLSVFVIMHY